MISPACFVIVIKRAGFIVDYIFIQIMIFYVFMFDM